MAKQVVEFIRELFKTDGFIPLHAPTFQGNEKRYVTNTIDSTFVSSVGEYVDEFERKLEQFTHSEKVVATVNGTSALHTSLYLAGVATGDMVITQALTFVATCNVITHMGAEPVFVDVSPVSLGMCPHALDEYLQASARLTETGCIHIATGKTIKAVVPMHTFGHPVELEKLSAVCDKWHLVLVEDAAESLGSYYQDKHTGTVGAFGALSFNGNKIITTGGGGAVLCKRKEDGVRAKHLTTQAKVPHPYEFYHDEAAFNFRMPNINAALGCAQMEQLPVFLANKRRLAAHYQDYFENTQFQFVKEPSYARSNYWLNAVICPDTATRNELLTTTNDAGVMTRPVWQLMHRLPMFADADRGELTYSEYLEGHLVNLPSSPVTHFS
ncbi:LegC family aminotransferase [Alteromonas sp. D210916BOD_24]|uniref:LegC family aminotransferase n=1 Tax=Alteromonas sp. D210916BOD_24 TaxID=3157618 RepID=UPI00399D49CC